MKKHLVLLLPALVLIVASSLTGRADQFTDIQNNPHTYWVPAPPGYVAAPPPPYYGYYGGPPGYYYGPPPPPAPPPVRFFFGFHFH